MGKKTDPKAAYYDAVLLEATKDLYRNVITNAVRAEEDALSAAGSATLAYHRMVCGKSIKELQALDKKLSKFGDSEAVRNIRRRLFHRIQDERTVDNELKAIGLR